MNNLAKSISDGLSKAVTGVDATRPELYQNVLQTLTEMSNTADLHNKEIVVDTTPTGVGKSTTMIRALRDDDFRKGRNFVVIVSQNQTAAEVAKAINKDNSKKIARAFKSVPIEFDEEGEEIAWRHELSEKDAFGQPITWSYPVIVISHAKFDLVRNNHNHFKAIYHMPNERLRDLEIIDENPSWFFHETITWGDLDWLTKQELEPEHYDMDALQETIETAFQDLKKPSGIYDLTKFIAQKLYRHYEQGNAVDIKLGRLLAIMTSKRLQHTNAYMTKHKRLEMPIPTYILDATFDLLPYKDVMKLKVLEPIKNLRSYSYVTTTFIDNVTTGTNIKNDVDSITRILDHVAPIPDAPILVVHKKSEEARERIQNLMKTYDKFEGFEIKFTHWRADRGTNEFRDCGTLIVIGLSEMHQFTYEQWYWGLYDDSPFGSSRKVIPKLQAQEQSALMVQMCARTRLRMFDDRGECEPVRLYLPQKHHYYVTEETKKAMIQHFPNITFNAIGALADREKLLSKWFEGIDKPVNCSIRALTKVFPNQESFTQNSFTNFFGLKPAKKRNQLVDFLLKHHKLELFKVGKITKIRKI